MEIRLRPRFGREWKKLSAEIRRLAEIRIGLFRKNPSDSRLKMHKLHGELDGFSAFSINYKYRIIFEFLEEDVIEFYSIGDHDIYD
ncbi:MAG: type II toxin-antitoxin system mRNA interferase toxin, RelE/StbE family [Candidatus Taylorbacteria bacterium]|nr:type II toxin-antitoxin system mRNA interferase toxin, RelE/StbE family [Candidatus Taylorbacteria bacterium]